MDKHIIFGSNIANIISNNLHCLIKKLNIKSRLDIFLIGNDFASEIYVKNKINKAAEIGIEIVLNRFSENISQIELEKHIIESSNNHQVNGIIIQLPLPKHLIYRKLIEYIDPNKDVDGLHYINIGKFITFKDRFLLPCTAYGCLLLIKNFCLNYYKNDDLSGKKALVIGRSNIVGQPVTQLLLQENCTVTIAHSKTKNLEKEFDDAEIVVSAIGEFGIINPHWINKNAIVIDVGINRDMDGKIIGDLDLDLVDCLAITPVPGGVGPMTIIILMFNIIQATLGKSHLLTIESNLKLK